MDYKYLFAGSCLIFAVSQNLLYLLWQENLQQWLIDEKARDQFAIRAGTFTEVFWNDARQLMPELVYHRQVGFSFYLEVLYTYRLLSYVIITFDHVH